MKKPRLKYHKRGFLVVEAGGIEPPSRDISSKASTYLVALLHLATPNAKQQAKMLPAREVFVQQLPGARVGLSHFYDIRSAALGRSCGGRATLY